MHPASPTLTPTGAALLLGSIRRTSQRLWNDVLITADEKRKATAYFQQHRDDARKLNALNKRMGELILDRTPNHQRRAA